MVVFGATAKRPFLGTANRLNALITAVGRPQTSRPKWAVFLAPAERRFSEYETLAQPLTLQTT